MIKEMSKNRLDLVDTIRGFTIVNMIGFHACWFMCYFGILITEQVLFGMAFTIWERMICSSFIFISGFSYSLGRNQLKNGLKILSLGVGITVLSVLFAYDVRDIFGVLWILGLFPLLMYLPDKIIDKNKDFCKNKSLFLLIICILLLVFTWNINMRYLGLNGLCRVDLPVELYKKGYLMTFIGFMSEGFYSVDYFSIFPWIFMYLTGYFTQKIVRNTRFEKTVLSKSVNGLSWMGRHSLMLYIIHPVVLVIVLFLVSLVVR